MNLEDALELSPVVAILRGVRPDEVLDQAAALYDVGVRGVEVPLNSPDPLESVRRLAERFGREMAIGAGTVLDPAQVDAVAAAGGRLIISPNTDPAVVGRAVELGLDPAPGFATASEAFAALRAGARHLKLFPAVTCGPGHLRQLMAVLPKEITVWAVGGVGAENMRDWWAAGARAFGLGGELYRPGQPASSTKDKALRAVAAARDLR
jgi:2-dehydro-3-deoxyphosphogalactonate aldolase